MTEQKHTAGPWRWQGEDYRGGWGWQMLVGPNGEGLIVGQDPTGTPNKHLKAFLPVDPALCITGLAAHGKERVPPVHVFSEANARLIAAAPDLLDALQMVRDADDDRKSDGFPAIPPIARAKIDAAIAKAEGGE